LGKGNKAYLEIKPGQAEGYRGRPKHAPGRRAEKNGVCVYRGGGNV